MKMNCLLRQMLVICVWSTLLLGCLGPSASSQATSDIFADFEKVIRAFEKMPNINPDFIASLRAQLAMLHQWDRALSSGGEMMEPGLLEAGAYGISSTGKEYIPPFGPPRGVDFDVTNGGGSAYLASNRSLNQRLLSGAVPPESSTVPTALLNYDGSSHGLPSVRSVDEQKNNNFSIKYVKGPIGVYVLLHQKYFDGHYETWVVKTDSRLGRGTYPNHWSHSYWQDYSGPKLTPGKYKVEIGTHDYHPIIKPLSVNLREGFSTIVEIPAGQIINAVLLPGEQNRDRDDPSESPGVTITDASGQQYHHFRLSTLTPGKYNILLSAAIFGDKEPKRSFNIEIHDNEILVVKRHQLFRASITGKKLTLTTIPETVTQ